MAKAHLFTPFRVAGLELENRIVIAPMCQYSAEDDGRATDWHMIHLGHLALSGAALLTIEATAVVLEGRISPRDLGLWSDETERALAQTLASVRRWSDMPVAIQLAHAGRKASDARASGRAAHRSAPTSRAAGRPLRRPRCHSPKARILPPRSTARGLSACVTPSRRRPAARPGQASMPCRFLARMATCCTSFCRRWRTGETASTAAAWKTHAFRAGSVRGGARRVTMRVSGTDWAPRSWRIGAAARLCFQRRADARSAHPLGPNYQVPLAPAPDLLTYVWLA